MICRCMRDETTLAAKRMGPIIFWPAAERDDAPLILATCSREAYFGGHIRQKLIYCLGRLLVTKRLVADEDDEMAASTASG